MSFFTPTKLLAVAIAITPAHAFFTNNNNNRSSTSRIIAAVIVVAVVLLVVFMCYARRRRRAQTGPILGGPMGKPSRFGGVGGGFTRPWAQTQNNQFQNQNQGQNYQYPQAAPGTEYPPMAAGEPKPPPYTSEPGTFESPAGQQGQGSYAAPPGPPPQAHVNGQQNSFVGGFRT
ncbi:hypothetical protein DFH07DRAFT_858263 [Mycena maculata]|uniref:Uncharacterized protein n=1 Tax=Mycena maculata TaxID=230809 RepID=A0AAD7HHF4_9AGAR|nr:hypothetical protein DFH07DRAFT_858263 [Mycena maculata]